MCFGRSLKGDHQDVLGAPDKDKNLHPRPVHQPADKASKASVPTSAAMPEHFSPPQGPPPSQYAPPTGPPPSQYALPSGPPPSHQYAPPAGPPPGQYAPPPGPPPSKNNDPQPYHDWTAIPDNSLLPPPPSSGYDRSTASNAPEAEANRATQWCQHFPLYAPYPLSPAEIETRKAASFRLQTPPEFVGDATPLSQSSWRAHSKRGTNDVCLLGSLPLYSALADSPLVTEGRKTIYFEARILALGRPGGDAAMSVGFLAPPYPPFRQPGWHRGSLGVHSDDGHKYINDMWGGKDFVRPFKVGETVGLGMTFSLETPEAPPGYSAAPSATATADGGKGTTSSEVAVKAEVFFTRNGTREDGWDVNEERDVQQDLGVEGLGGEKDLLAAVGIYGEGVELEVNFGRGSWLYQPE